MTTRLPRSITIPSPYHVTLELCVFAVIDRHPDGSPRTLKYVKEDEEVDLEEHSEFVTLYGVDEIVKPNGA